MLLIVGLLTLSGCTFVQQSDISNNDLPGLFSGVWHGMVAPYSLIVRFFADVKMYAFPNTGWFYDLGFLLGVALSLPVGWAAAIISVIFLIIS